MCIKQAMEGGRYVFEKGKPIKAQISSKTNE